jgi:phage terminase Nu1 subunit (DNA packaging protein)
MKPRKHATAEDIGRVSAELVGDLFGVSRTTFAKWCNEGIIERQSPTNGYELRTVCRAVLEHYRRVASGRGVDGADTDALTAQRVRLAKAKAEREERQNAIEARQVARVAPIQRFLEHVFISFRNRVLNLPGEISALLADRAQEEVFEALDQAVRSKLEELADPKKVAAEAAAAGLAEGRNVEHHEHEATEDDEDYAPDVA